MMKKSSFFYKAIKLIEKNSFWNRKKSFLARKTCFLCTFPGRKIARPKLVLRRWDKKATNFSGLCAKRSVDDIRLNEGNRKKEEKSSGAFMKR